MPATVTTAPGSPSTAPATTHRGPHHERTAGDDVTEPHGIRHARARCASRRSATSTRPTPPTPCCARSPTATTTSPSPLGDLSYGADGEEEAWCRFVTRRVGAEHPFELVSGNHESNGENGNIERFARCLPNRLPGLVGTLRAAVVRRPAGRPPARAGRDDLAGARLRARQWSYAKGTPHYDWLRAAVTGARAAGIPWVVVGMHKPCLSVGNYECDPGADVVDLLLDTGVDLVLTGHEHLYQRTEPLALAAGCRTIRPGSYDPDCVATGGGTTFVTVGTGGTPLRDVHGADSERRYFAALSGKDLAPSHGSLDVRVTADRLTAPSCRWPGACLHRPAACSPAERCAARAR